MNYGRPLFDILRKSIDYPRGKLIAFNIEAREARALIKRFSKKDLVVFELIPSTVREVLNAKDYYNLDGSSKFGGVQHSREAYGSYQD